MSHQHETPEEDPGFQDLEEKLARLQPLPPSERLSQRLGDRLEAISADRVEKRIVWARFAPVAAAACVVFTSAYLFERHLRQPAVEESPDLPTASVAAPLPPAILEADDETGAPIISDWRTSPSRGFLPVAGGRFIGNAREGDIAGFDPSGLPVRKWFIDIEDAEYWFDPLTRTSLRIVNDHEGFFYLPVVTE